MKRILLFLMSMVFCFCFSACKNDARNDRDLPKAASGFLKSESEKENEIKYDDYGNQILGEGEITKNNIFMIKDENENLLISNSDVEKVVFKFDVAIEEYVIQLYFNDEGALKFEKATRENIGKSLSIWLSVYVESSEVEEEPFYDLQLLSSPMVQEEIKGGACVISGFQEEEAREIFENITK